MIKHSWWSRASLSRPIRYHPIPSSTVDLSSANLQLASTGRQIVVQSEDPPGSSSMRSTYDLLGVPQPFDPSDRYTTSWLLPPAIFACLRLFLSIYAFTTIFFIFGWNGSHNRAQKSTQSFSYFTNLTYWGLAFYFLFSALHTFSYARAGRSWLQSWHRPFQAAHAIFYSSIITYPFLVTIVFWAVLYSGPWYSVNFYAWSNISQHALNSLFALFEIFLPRTQSPPPSHLPLLILLLALYLALAYLTHATQGFYTYTFLDPHTGSARVVGYVFGILVAICVIFAGVWGLVWGRRRVTEVRWGMKGKFSGRGRRREGDVEIEMEGGEGDRERERGK